VEGERLVTSAEAGAFPAGLPVGVVRCPPRARRRWSCFARLDRLDLVRLFDYGLGGILPPESVARPEPRGRR
jgi:rod shape-determining protein MreC